ncbi:MAG: YybH family protein, partial [Pirellulaceae bacterium]
MPGWINGLKRRLCRIAARRRDGTSSAARRERAAWAGGREVLETRPPSSPGVSCIPKAARAALLVPSRFRAWGRSLVSSSQSGAFMPSRHHDPSFRACGYALLLVLGVVWGSAWAQSSNPTAAQPSTATASPSPEAVALVMAQLDKLTTAFNSGNVSGVSGLFHPEGELIDEAGTIYQGRAEIETLAQAFFAKYPGVQMVAQ